MTNRTAEHDCCSTPEQGTTRRSFLTLATLSAGVALLAPVMPARAAGTVDALLLSCMDYRLMDEIVTYMNGRGLKDQYDHVVLAGASLGALTEKKPGWGEAFWDHVQVAKDLHHIKRVIILDHRDCGAYKVFLGADLKDDAAKEMTVHAEHLRKLGGMVKQKHPDLMVELGLMGIDGKVEAVPLAA